MTDISTSLLRFFSGSRSSFFLISKFWKLFLLFQMHFNCMDAVLKSSFYKCGYFVGRHPGYFTILIVLLSMLCITGFQKIHNNIDPEYLFSPINGPGKYERAVVEEHFKLNYTHGFNLGRITRAGAYFTNLLRKACLLFIIIYHTINNNKKIKRKFIFEFGSG